MRYIEPMAKLIEHFRALPGIGSKTAVRLAYHILDMEPAQAKALAAAIPTRRAPTRPGPSVTATADRSWAVIPASARAS